MRRRNLLLAGTKYLFVGGIVASAFAAASPAVYADGMAKAKPMVAAAPADWSGFYIGLQSGYQWSSIDGGYNGGPLVNQVDFDSGLIGAHMGLQHQFGNVVLGVEGTWLSALRDDPGSTVCPNPVFTCTHKLNDILSIGGRLGWASGHWMPYVTGGYASARFEAFHYIPPGALATNEYASTRNNGWYLGAGFDWVIAPNWTTGLEYRHYDFDTESNAWYRLPPGGQLGTYAMEGSVDTITLRTSWKFGRQPAPPPPLK